VLNKKLIRTALITSPLIAIFGASPFYIFAKIKLSSLSIFFIGITLDVLVIFAMHIIYVNKVKNSNNAIQFLVTYLVGVAVRLTLNLIAYLANLKEPPEIESYLAYPIITSFALNALIMIIVNALVNKEKKVAVEKKLQELILENTIAQKKVLQQQLQPHFLFNSLSVLKSLISQSPEKAQNYVVQLSEFLRYSVQSSNTELVSIQKELAFTKDYIELQKVRFEEAISYTIDLPTDILDKQIPILSLQILVENIFKHNYFTIKNPLHFSISFKDNYIIVQNAKVSLRLKDGSGTGLQNLIKRYELLNAAPVLITETENNFEVKIPIF
jgi:two-component system, LytTR family, sensor kinase